MIAQIIQFPAAGISEWPAGMLGIELERLAQMTVERAEANGRRLHIAIARKQLLDAFRGMDAQLQASLDR